MFSEEIFSQRLRGLRLSKRLTLQQVADALETIKGTVGNLEHGRKKPSVDMLIALSNFYGVTTDYLLGLSDDPSPRR